MFVVVPKNEGINNFHILLKNGFIKFHHLCIGDLKRGGGILM